MKRILINTLILFLMFFSRSSLKTQNDFPILKGAYFGCKPPALEAEILPPGIITTELHDDASPVFSLGCTTIS